MSTNSTPATAAAAPIGLRIGDQERDRAADCLREHMASGRLDAEEFDQRLESALTARVQSDLDQLFVDLPAPHPPAAHSRPTRPDPRPAANIEQPADECSPMRSLTGWNAVAGLVWTAAVMVCVVVGWDLWWLLFVPFFVSANIQKHRRVAHRQRRAALQLGPMGRPRD